MAQSLALSIGGHGVRFSSVPAVNRPVFTAKGKDICGLLASGILQGTSWSFDDTNRFFEMEDA